MFQYNAIGQLKNKRFSPSGTTLNSKQTGNWTDASTWLSGLLPNANDNVTINTGHTLTIPNGQIVGAGILNDRGTLRNFGTLNMGKFSTTDLYNQSMSYHIRGALRGINLDNSGNLTNALFSMKLFYEDDQIYFDGNIRKQEWKTGLDNVTRSFTYRYDGSSRIKAGSYVGKVGENYTLSDVIYDDNGNIKKLIRNGLISGNTFGIVDNLNYTYNTNSNKILKVDDVSNVAASFADVAGNDYTYLADGSLASDANKGITKIEYNYLKRPKKFTFSNGSTLENQYDATGKKLKSISSDGTVFDFMGNVIYKNNTLYQISHDEGRIIKGEYEYEIKDYLGNLRVAFRDSLGIAKITQKQDYDIYGSELQGLSYTKPLWNQDNFKFLGRESIAQTGYVDLLNRQYDKILGRFISPDPVTDGQESQSLFQYSWNNPVLLSDPNGDYPDGGGDDTQSEFFLARLVTTAFYDVKHAIFNTGARAVGSNYRASYATNSDGQEVFETKYAKAAIPTTLKGVGKEVVSGLLDVMVVSGVKAGPAGIGVLAESSETQTARGVRNVAEGVSKTGKYTEPTLPNKTIVKQDGVEVKHYYKSGDHAPAHMHVEGKGGSTKIGANGKPIKGSSELSKTQSDVINANKSIIRSAGNKINNYQKYQNYRQEQ